MSIKNENDDGEEQIISKTDVKKEMHELKKLGSKLVELPDSQLKKIPLDEQLLDAIKLAKSITKHGGLKRQLMFIGKLMRHVDAEPIQKALLEIENGYQQDTHIFHLKEQWREDLLEGGNAKLTEFLNLYPSSDMQRLRQLIRNHQTAKTDDKKKQNSRQIFKLISEQIVEQE